MSEIILTEEKATRPPVSIATYAAIAATLLIMVLSGIMFAASPGDTLVRPAYDPAASLVGFASAD